MRRLVVLPVVTLLLAAANAQAAPVLRVQVDQHGDFLLIGNTLGYDCDTGTPAPVVGTLSSNACMQSTSNLDDSSPDVYWSADDPAAGQALADINTLASAARSTSVLTVPSGATVTNAYLYWAATNTSGVASTTVTLQRPGTGGFGPTTITAGQSWVAGSNNAYQAMADITTLVQANGSGAYRVSGIDVAPFANVDVDVLFGGWFIVVFYELASDPLRNLALFDGYDVVKTGQDQSATLSGFLVPKSGFSGKLGVAAFEGDNQATGDSLSFNGTKLSDAMNPVDNFFNSTRSWLGSPVSVTGDLPQLTGTPQSMAGVDLDVVDITAQLSQGQTSAPIQATTGGDTYFLSAFVTSLSTFAEDFSTSTKTAGSTSDGGVFVDGSTIRYTITAINSGNDASVKTVVTDPLPTQVSYVPGSITIDGVTKTDAAGDDQAEYDATTRVVTARLGTGANATTGGSVAVGAQSVVSFEVKINAGVLGDVANQGTIQAGGAMGAPVTNVVTDGNGAVAGSPATIVTVVACATNGDCAAPTPICDTAAMPPTCVGCLTDSDCGGPTSGEVCDTTTDTCVPGCRGTGGNACPQGQTCTSTTNGIGQCESASSSASSSSSGGGAGGSGAGGSGVGGGAGGGGGSSSTTSSVTSSSQSTAASSGSSSGTSSGAGGGTGGPVNKNDEGSCKCSLEPREDRFAWSLGVAVAALAASRRRNRQRRAM